ncbi:MAG: cation:proton antiporter, partial [Thermoplasmata archaeon]|nr:cation:proton antiporter [Thermoplasmata archaeon]
FIAAGLDVSVAAVVGGAILVVALFGVKVGAKLAGVLPLARRWVGHDAMYIGLLMSTGLTFGTIASLYGYNSGIIDKTQFSVLLTVVISTAIIPTLIAERWFHPPEGVDTA